MEQYQGDGTQVRDGILGFETSSEYPGFLVDQVREVEELPRNMKKSPEKKQPSERIYPQELN